MSGSLPSDNDGPDEARNVGSDVPNIARVYDYLLGGKDNFAVDREAAEGAIAAFPGTVAAAKANRAFLGRAVRYLVREAGVRQFLDVGTGMPTVGNTSEIAQATAPECRVVCVDNDPVVISHARALLTSTPQGAVDYIEADLRDVGKILADAAGTLDFSRPVAVMLVAVLHFIPGEQAYDATAGLMAAVVPGSCLAISHIAADIKAQPVGKMIRQANQVPRSPVTTLRSRDEVARFFDGCELAEPGVVPLEEWRPDSEFVSRVPSVSWCGVARKR